MSRRSKARNGRSILHRLSGDSGGSWGERIRYHGARGLLLVGLAAIVTFSFPPVRGTDVQQYSVGMVAP